MHREHRNREPSDRRTRPPGAAPPLGSGPVPAGASGATTTDEGA